MREAAEVAREPRAAAQLQAAHLGIGKQPVRGHLAAQRRDLGESADVPTPRPGHRAGPFRVPSQQCHEDLAQREQCRLPEDPDQGQTGVVLQHGAQLVAPLQVLECDRVPPAPLPRQVERL